MKNKQGICYLVGAGPGDPGLVTLRAKECIERADLIIYDYLCNPELLSWAKPGAETIYAGKKAGDHTLTQTETNTLLRKQVAAGRCVVRLKGGDPFVFGRGGEEAQELAAAGLRFEIVPGISSAIAGPAYAGIPVTHRAHNTQLTIFTGHEDPSKKEGSLDLAQIARAPGTKVMLMGVERIAPISEGLVANGMASDTPIALIRWATTGRQQTLVSTLADVGLEVARTGFAAPAVAVIGDVVRLRESLNWFESKPLFGRRIVVTRTRRQAGGLSARLRELGADVLEIPVIRIEPPPNAKLFREMVADTHRYDWLLFTSPNGADAFFSVFFDLFSDAREIGGVRIAAVGPATAARVRSHFLAVDLQPEKFVAEEVVRCFKAQKESVENLQMLLVQAETARDVLPKELEAMGAIVDVAVAYRTVPETESPALERFRAEGADMITFTSSSTVENFLALGTPLPDGIALASIGPVTSQTLQDQGLKAGVEAKRHDIEGLVEAIVAHFASK